MPATKEQLRRLMELDRLFQNEQRWKASELLQKLADESDIQISDRTLKDDLAYLKTESDGILTTQKIGRDWLWYYTESTYSHFRKSLLPNEFADLQRMITTFKGWGDLPFWQEIELMLSQFEVRLTLSNRPNRKLIDFQKPISTRGGQWLSTLYKAIDNQSVTRISYHSLRTNANVITDIYPYLLKEYNNRWWLIGWAGKSIINVALETVYNVEDSETVFDNIPEFDPDSYFASILGVTVNHGEPEIIRLKVAPDSVNYLKTKPLHESQRPANDDGTEITLKLIPNYELQQAILQYGSRIEVLWPESLRETISGIIHQAAQNYQAKI